MDELSIEPDYVKRLVWKVRTFMADEAPVIEDPGDNPTDDPLPTTLQEGCDDPSREEVIEEIDGLGPEKQAELVALMWLGRDDDAGPEDWGELLNLARERQEVSTARYLLDHPLVADYWAMGLEKLGYGTLAEE